jgi:hypothetical protein
MALENDLLRRTFKRVKEPRSKSKVPGDALVGRVTQLEGKAGLSILDPAMLRVSGRRFVPSL